MMRRREFVAATSTVLSSPLTRAKPSGRTYRIGYLGYAASADPQSERIWTAFARRLAELGYVEGANLTIERRFAEGQIERYVPFAAELVRLRVDVVVVGSIDAAKAVMAASRTLPVVTFASGDPVRTGLVASLAHPGGQLTGVTNLAIELDPKRLELIKSTLPDARRVAIAHCPRCARRSQTEMSAQLEAYQAAARALGMALLPIDVNAASDFESARAVLRRERPDALLIGATPINVPLRDRWLEFAAAERMPMMAPYRGFGGFLTYGPDLAAIFVKVAEYIARILEGAAPGDLPMEEPTKFEFVVNLKIAKALGITVPPSVLLRADVVIE